MSALACSGCSLIFVKSPPNYVARPTPHPNADCTTSRAAPIIDGLIGGYEVFRTAYALQASEGDYYGSPISREADILLGLGFTALFVGSAIHGGVSTSRCHRLKNGPPPGEETPGVTEEWTSTPATSVTETPWAAAPAAPAASAESSTDEFSQAPAATAPAPSPTPPANPSAGFAPAAGGAAPAAAPP